MKKRCISLLLSLCFCISTGTVIPAYAQNTSPDVKVFYSSYNDLDNTYKLTDLTQDKNIQFSHVWDAISEGTAGIVVDPSVTYQTWEGFGGSLDGATIYYLNQLEQSDYEQLMEQKDRLYEEYAKMKKKVKQYDTIKQNVDGILRQPKQAEREQKSQRIIKRLYGLSGT